MSEAEARAHHEKPEYQKEALRLLRSGTLPTSAEWFSLHSSRLAPVIERLRNAHGFEIVGEGSSDNPYRMLDCQQLPGLVSVTEEIKNAYYMSDHWRKTSTLRLIIDDYKCAVCKEEAEVVHHIVYRLFSEAPRNELISLCAICHERLHDNCKLAFPSGIAVEHVFRLGLEPHYDEWLMPELAIV